MSRACFVAILGLVLHRAAARSTIIARGSSNVTVSPGDGLVSVRTAGSAADAVAVRLATVRELGSSGQELESTGQVKHSVTISAGATGAFALGPVSADASAGVAAESVVAASSGTLIQGATSASITTTTSVFTAAGTARPEGSGGIEARVGNGTVEVRTSVSSWPWCTLSLATPIATCLIGASRQAGAYLELVYELRSRSEALVAASTAASVTIDLGGGAEVEFSKQASVGGTYAAVASGFPRLEVSSATSATVIVRVPRGSSSSGDIAYDPFVRPSGGGSASSQLVLRRGQSTVSVLATGAVSLTSPGSSGPIGVSLASVAEAEASGSAAASKTLTLDASAGLRLGALRASAAFGVNADMATSSTTFLGRASVSQDITVFRASGTIRPEGSAGIVMAVRNGTTKTATTISGWPWGSGGDALDLRFRLDTRASARVLSRTASAVVIDLGGGGSATFSSRANVGGSLQALADGTPTLESASSTSATVLVRLRRPSEPGAEVRYDPAVEDGTSGAGSAAVAAAAWVLAAAAAVMAVRT